MGAGTRIQVTPAVSIDLGAAYLLVLDAGSGAGQIKSSAFFPSTKALGVDLGASRRLPADQHDWRARAASTPGCIR